MLLETTPSCPRTPIVLMALEEAGAAYDLRLRESGYFSEHYGTAGPLLLDDGHEILGLDTILRHVARSCGARSLMPTAPREAARVDHWMEFHATCIRAPYQRFISATDESARTEVLSAIRRHLATLERAVGDAYLLGQFTLADCLYIGLAEGSRIGIRWEEFPNVAAYMARLRVRPAWKRAELRYGELLRRPTAAPETALDKACSAWTALLGEAHVVRSTAALDRAARTTLPEAPRPAAILRPAHREQVPESIRIARKFGVPLYPISRGRNWGWGDACPAGDGQVVLDLGRLDRMTIDTDLGYAVVEPGVTQGMLAEQLRGTDWRLDCTAAGPETSVVGNALERGLTCGVLGERFAAVCGIEAVLGDGSVVRTGFGHCGSTRVAHTHRAGAGPALDGLFSQSSFGVVTELGIWLSPVPAHQEIVCVRAPEEALERLLDTLRPLRIRGVLPTNVHVYLLPDGRGDLHWCALGALMGGPAAVAEHWSALEAAMTDFAACARLMSGEGAREAFLAAIGLPGHPILYELAVGTKMLVDGVPAAPPPEVLVQFAGGPLVQKPLAPLRSSDPLDADLGLVFVWQSCSALGAEARRLYDIARDCLADHDCPPLLTFQLVNGRGAVLVTRIGYDRKHPSRRAAARDCHTALLERGLASGFPPARMGVTATHTLDPFASPTSRLVERLKAACDPDGILAPGRYGIRRA